MEVICVAAIIFYLVYRKKYIAKYGTDATELPGITPGGELEEIEPADRKLI